MKRSTILLLLYALTCLVGSGCYSQKPIPHAYFEQEPEIAVVVDECPEAARMRDSGQGGLIGALVTAGRATR